MTFSMSITLIITTILIVIGIAVIWYFGNDFLPKIVTEILLVFIATLLSSSLIFSALNENMHSFTLNNIFMYFIALLSILGTSYIAYETIEVFTDNSVD